MSFVTNEEPLGAAKSTAFQETISGGLYFDVFVIILLENKNIGSIYNSSSAPYLTALANAGALLHNHTAIDHPSEPNYIALGSGLAGDCSDPTPNIGGCLSGGGDSTS